MTSDSPELKAKGRGRGGGVREVKRERASYIPMAMSKAINPLQTSDAYMRHELP